ncbi:hypothetical protein XI09_12260 [Bradyrhizobium sp. CCBAU 11386]|nr:hypothetical protein [Bradyrhizobium sp. CCBAU 11386]
MSTIENLFQAPLESCVSGKRPFRLRSVWKVLIEYPAALISVAGKNLLSVTIDTAIGIPVSWQHAAFSILRV